MEIKKTVNGNNLIVALKGRLDTVTAPELEKELSQSALDGAETVTLDMSELEYVSSSGLRVILVLHKNMSKLGGALKIINVNSMIMELFKMTGMSDYLDIQA